MRFTPDQLRDKALFALEEALQEIRFSKAFQTAALRFALAYLWSMADVTPEPYDRFWKCLGARSAGIFTAADTALEQIYHSLGVTRDEEVSNGLWRKAYRKYVANLVRGHGACPWLNEQALRQAPVAC